ncbi:hypothetical protein [Micromonospora musae]|uniref:hypothetical protein n=1 Tax=Micromonospora musae TaxID=1894970 RepID=UPI0011C401F5|nr:hypothetical protein [Micromonospora musae]
MESQPARRHLHHVRDRFSFGGELRRPLHALGVDPGCSPLEVPQPIQLSKQSGADEGRPPDASPEQCPAQWTSRRIGEDLTAGASRERFTVGGQQVDGGGGVKVMEGGGVRSIKAIAQHSKLRVCRLVVSAPEKGASQHLVRGPFLLAADV